MKHEQETEVKYPTAKIYLDAGTYSKEDIQHILAWFNRMEEFLVKSSLPEEKSK